MEGSSIQAAAPHDIENPNPNPYVQLGTSLMKELDRLSPMSPSRCIFRVPHRLRCEREKAVHYTPKVISIGPLHHGNEALKAMEEHKKRYLQYFMGRTNFSLMDYIEEIRVQEARLRNCYSETIELKSDEFVRIILVDAIFVIEFLFRNWYPKLLDENDCIFGEPRMVEDVWPDLLMLENQLPFFILEHLFDPAIFPVPSKYSHKLKGVERLSILFLSHYFLNSVPTFEGMLGDLETINSSEAQVKHFVDLFRKLFIAPTQKKQSEGQSKPTTVWPWLTLPPVLKKLLCLESPSLDPKKEEERSAGLSKFIVAPSIEELHLAGVKFKVGSTNNLFDIRFKDGILEIPKLRSQDRTEIILRNLVAFEQCSTSVDRYISDYVCIMDSFVDTPKDVELLVKYRIVENLLGGGDNELSTMINSLSTGVIYSWNFYYNALSEDLNKFCGYKWNKRMANLRHNYFNTPWATISFAAAVVLLVLTVIQTIYSII